jgi:hypothetical protein
MLTRRAAPLVGDGVVMGARSGLFHLNLEASVFCRLQAI